MIARRLLAAAALPLALVVAGCGGGATNLLGPQAARVGDEVLSQDDLVDTIEMYSDNPEAAEALGGTVAGTWSAPTLSQVVNQWVQEELLLQLGDEEGIEPTEADLESARELVTGGQDVSGVPDEIIDRAIEATAIRNVLGQRIAEEEGFLEIPEEAIVEAYEAQRESSELLCVRQIVLYYDEAAPTDPTFVATPEQEAATEERAEAVAARLEQGEEFATVAVEESDDAASASAEPQCVSPAEITDPAVAEQLADLDAGGFTEPIEFGVGLAILGVDSRETPTLEEQRASIEQQLQQEAASQADALLGQTVARFARDVGVWVDGRYGTWDAEAVTVVPPSGPVPPSTTLPALDPGSLIDPSQLEQP